MPELLSDQAIEFVSGVLLPGLQVVAALLTLLVLAFTLRWSGRTLTRSVTPQVECYLRLRESHLFELVIANFGSGTAYNVDLRLHVDEDDFAAHEVLMEQRRTDHPFAVLEPGGQIKTVFGAAFRLLGRNDALKPFRATVTYEWQPFWSKRRRAESLERNVDVRPFAWVSSVVEKDKVAEVLKAELPKITRILGTTRRPPVPADRRSGGEAFFKRIEGAMPDLFEAMREDLKSFPMKREFVLFPKGALYNAGRKEPLAYFFEEHDDLADKVGLLVNEGVVTDITYNNVDRYLMSEALVEYLEKEGVDDQQ